MDILSLIQSNLQTILIIVCASLLPIIILVGVGVYIYFLSQKSKKYRQAAQNWVNTTGTILTSVTELRRGGGKHASYTNYPVVTYQFQANGKTYQSQNIKISDQFITIMSDDYAQEIVNKYPAGSQVAVYYNPNNPLECALER
ncbi:MAG: DUF3592 domain-containing protein [Anaerolineales bacterium]